MVRIRVRELAKELNVKNVDLLSLLSEQLGLHDLKPASGIDDGVADKVRKIIVKEQDKGSEAEVVKKKDGTVVKKHRTFVLKKRKKKVEKPPDEELASPVEGVEEGAEASGAPMEEVQEASPEEAGAVAEIPVEDGTLSDVAQSEASIDRADIEEDGAAAEQEATAPEVEPKSHEKKELTTEEQVKDEKLRKKKPKIGKKQHKGALKKKVLEELSEEPIEEDADDRKKPQIVERVFEPGRSFRKRRPVEREKKGPSTLPPKPKKMVIRMEEVISAGELAKRMGVKSSEVIKKLLDLGMTSGINELIEAETASLVADDFGYKIENIAPEYESLLDQKEDSDEELSPRAAVVTIMGHVDHGKTSLLDAVRKTSVAEKEAGGITQSIGAYEVEVGGNRVVFIDTPGHEAFTQMRARGAKITDLVVLVVAADDGVMPQTLEAIDHAKAANVPIVVAVNKMDKQNANPDKVKKDLSEHGLIPDEWGGDVLFSAVSAKKEQGIDELLEHIVLQADLLELKANENKLARGVIIESRIDRGRGPVASVIVQEGTLKTGDAVVSGKNFGKVKALLNHVGKRVKKAPPSTPVEIVGFNSVPDAGEKFASIESERLAREIAFSRESKEKEKEGVKTAKLSLEELYERIKEGGLKELPVIIKADVQGSVEAIKDALVKVGTEEVKISIIHTGVGGINESDILLASASNAIVIGFNVRPDTKAVRLAESEKVDINVFEIIYELIDSVKKAMIGLLEPEYKENLLGVAEVREVFSIPKVGSVAGCYVTDGKILRNSSARLLRDNIIIYTGKISSLKRFKDDAREVTQGYECGIGLEDFNDIKAGDQIESFMLEEIAPTL